MTTVYAPSPCAAKPARLPRPKDVTVNGVLIDRAAIARETQNHPAGKPVEAWLAATRSLVVRELLLQEARRLDIAASPLTDDDGRCETPEEALIRALVEQQVLTPSASEAECRRVYEHGKRRFRSADLYEVRHILCAADPRDLAARTDARRGAEEAIAMLSTGQARFAELAARISACPSGKTGGSLGQVSRGQTVPEFEAALERLPVGMIAAHPVESRYGFHVVCIDRRIEGVQLPFEAVRDHVAAWLEEKVRRTAIRQYIAGLAGRAEIGGVTLEASDTPLVQ